jgi:hypothetical protein
MLLVAYLAAVIPSQIRTHAAVDSIAAERLIRADPHRVPLKMEREITNGPFFALMTEHLQQIRYSELSPATVSSACGNLGDTVNRLALRIHDENGWTNFVIPDGCKTSSPALNQQLTALRDVAQDVIAGSARPRRKWGSPKAG